MDPPWHHFGGKPPKHHSLTLNPQLFGIKNFFRRSIWLKRWALLSSVLIQKIRKILRAVLEKRPKKSKNTFFSHSITYNLGLRIFQKNHLAQTMSPIVLHTHAKIYKILGAVLEKKAKSHHTYGQNGGQNDAWK